VGKEPETILVSAKEAEAISVSAKGVSRKWVWYVLAAGVALQAYYFRELLAALILFAAVFVVLVAGGLLLYLVQVGGTRAIAVAEATLKSAGRAPRHPTPAPRAQ